MSTRHKTYFAQGADSHNAAYRPDLLVLSGDGHIFIKPAKWSSWTGDRARRAGLLLIHARPGELWRAT